MSDLLQLWTSGELAKLAIGCRDGDELAERVGLTSRYALRRGLDKLREAGHIVPTIDVLRRGLTAATFDTSNEKSGFSKREVPKAGIDVLNLGTDDFSDDEPTAEHVIGKRDDFNIEAQLAERRERSEVVDLRAKLKRALDALEQTRLELVTSNDAKQARAGVLPIAPRETSSGLREATAVALASDWHIEERVDPASVNGVNEYNLDIARRRCERYFNGVAYLLRYHQDHFAIRDLVLWLGGDLITGYLREENLEHNELSPVQAIATLHVWLADGIRSLLKSNLETIRVVCNSGNHGRLTEKVRPSTREANSIEWLMYTGLAREFANEPRVQFTLPHGSQTYAEIYDWTIRFTHGDETKFGGGVGGIMIPIRKAIAKWQTIRHADLTVMGHYHSEHFLRDLVVNGSLVGYSPYSLSIAAPYEDPRQSFFLIDKHRGMTFPSTVWVADREGVRR